MSGSDDRLKTALSALFGVFAFVKYFIDAGYIITGAAAVAVFPAENVASLVACAHYFGWGYVWILKMGG
jgi:hypothetical protein